MGSKRKLSAQILDVICSRHKNITDFYDLFYEWVEQQNYPVYMSEYDAPIKEIYAFKRLSTLSSNNNKKKTIEKLYWNGKGEINKTELF